MTHGLLHVYSWIPEPIWDYSSSRPHGPMMPWPPLDHHQLHQPSPVIDDDVGEASDAVLVTLFQPGPLGHWAKLGSLPATRGLWEAHFMMIHQWI